MTDKENLRKIAMEARHNINAEMRHVFECSIAEHFQGIIPHIQGQSIALYNAIRGEVRCDSLRDIINASGYKIGLPVVADRDEPLVFRLFQGSDKMKVGYVGIREPDETCLTILPDIVCTPLLAFDENGGRLGYGAGHYDRSFIAMREQGHSPLKIGLAFECQKFDHIPCEAHDQPLDYVITENKVYNFKR